MALEPTAIGIHMIFLLWFRTAKQHTTHIYIYIFTWWMDAFESQVNLWVHVFCNFRFLFFCFVVDFKQKKILRRCNSWVVGFFAFFLQIPQRKHHYLSYISVKLICHSLTLLFRSASDAAKGGRLLGGKLFQRLNDWRRKVMNGWRKRMMSGGGWFHVFERN